MEAPASTPSNDDANSNSQIQPNIEIDVNQAIPQVTGGNVFANVTGNVTIYHSPEAAKAVTNKDLKIGANPYKGLLAFQETDGDRFFGRDLQIKELWEKFRSLYEDGSQSRLLTIYGPSGSGKSSLARAGLIPEMGRRYLAGYEQARVVVVIPKTHPLESLALELARMATNDPTPADKANEFLGTLVKVNAEGSYEGLRQIANMLPRIEISPLIVLVDQFEEVFTQCKDSDERNAFICNLLCAAADRSKQVSLILTLRSDFLGMTQTYPQLNQLIATQGFLVAVMDKVGLREAIAKPAELAKHPLDLSTIDLLIEQTADREGALPLLQFALERIWAGLIEGKEPVETLQEIGGVGGALAGEAQRIYGSLTPEEQGIARRVFLGLVQLGEGAKDTRRRVELERLVSHRDSLDRVKKVIDKFANRDTRLITLSNDGGVETAEVTHEALFDNWPQLRDWLDRGRSDLRFQRRLDDAVMVWQENGRPEGNLWRSPDLDLLRRYQERAGDNLTPQQLEFFQGSIDAEQSQNEADKKRVQTEKYLAEVKLIAAEERVQAEKNLVKTEKKQKRQVAIALIVTSGVAIFALAQVQQVQRQRMEQLAANVKVLLAGNETVDAVINAIAAKGLSQSVFVQFPDYPQFASVEKSLLNAVRHNRERTEFLVSSMEGDGCRANSVSFSPDGKRIISHGQKCMEVYNALTGAHINEPSHYPKERIDSVPDNKNKINSVVYSPDGKHSVSSNIDNTMKIRDVQTGAASGNSLRGHTNSINSMMYSPDGKYIVSGSSDSTVRIWDAQTGLAIGKPLIGQVYNANEVVSVAYSPDGKHIVSGSDLNGGDSIVQVLDLPTVALVGEPWQGHKGFVYSVAYSPDGKHIASCSWDNTIRIWDSQTGVLIGKPLIGHKDRVHSVAYSRDGKHIVSGSWDNTVRIWDAQTGAPIGKPLIGHKNSVNSVAYSPDGKHIVSGGSDNNVRIWNAQTGMLISKSLLNQEHSVYSVAYSPDGKYIVSSSGPYSDSHNHEVRIWNAQTGESIGKPLLGHEDYIYSVAYSPNGKYIVSGSRDKTVRIWDAQTGAPIGKPLRGHNQSVTSVSYSPDGKLIVSSGNDNTIRIWDAQTGVPISEPLQDENDKMPILGEQDPDGPGDVFYAGINSVAYSPDGSHIISGSNDGMVRLWDISSKSPDVSWKDLLPIACNQLRYHRSLKDPQTDIASEAKQTCEQYVWKK